MKIRSKVTRAAMVGAVVSAVSGEAEERLVEISFSSEEPYLRHGSDGPFQEVLGHGDGEVDLSRLSSGAAPLLTDHFPSVDTQAGVVVRAWVEDGKGRALVRFAKTPDADQLLAKVRDGIVTCVSVGYRILRVKRAGDDPDGVPVLRVVDWQPYEVSFVSIPADPTVGIGRDAAEDAPEISVPEEPQEREDDMNKPINTPATPAPVPSAEEIAAIRAAALKEATTAVREIDAYAETFGLPAEMVSKAKKELGEGTRDPSEVLSGFRDQALTHAETSSKQSEIDANATRIGMQAEDVKVWSLEKALRYLADPSRANTKEAGFEIEASEAYEKKTGKTSRGLFIPDEVILDPHFSRNNQNTGTAADGGALVPTNYMAGSFIDLLRKRSALVSLGANFMNGLRGDVDIPKRLQGGTLGFYNEGEDTAEGTNQFGNVPLSPHTASMALSLTRRLRQNGSPDTEALLRNDLLAGAATGTDAAALVGGFGSKAPQSLRDRLLGASGTPGVVAFTATGQPTYQECVRLWRLVAENSADMGNMGYVFGAAIAEHLMTTPKMPSGEIPILGDAGTVAGHRRFVTEQIAPGEMIFGNWSDLLVGYFSGFDLKRDDSTYAASDGTVIRLFVDMDTNVRHLESFSMGQ